MPREPKSNVKSPSRMYSGEDRLMKSGSQSGSGHVQSNAASREAAESSEQQTARSSDDQRGRGGGKIDSYWQQWRTNDSRR